MLGDSFAYGLGVERQHGYADVLEQLLARTQVVNLAVAGYATDQEVLLFEREYPRWQPHAVILLMYGNDLIHNTQRTVYTHYTKPKFAIVDDQLQLRFAPRARPGIDTRLNHWLATRSAAYYRLQFLYATAKTPPVPFFRSRALGILGRLTGDMPVDRLEITQALVVRLRDAVVAAGAELLVVFAVAEFQLDDVAAKVDRDELATRLARHGIAFLDTAPALKEHRSAFPADALSLPGDAHWNQLAHGIAAAASAEVIERMGLASRRPDRP